ncbi:Fructose import ATP-binding protein FrcA [subsurface metagenome]
MVILDEPTAALEIKQTEKVNELIKSLKEKNMSVIVITHNLHHIFLIADRVIVLRQGRRVGEKVIRDTDGDEVVKMINGDEFARNES